jgi:hypothetical protein
MLRQARSTSDKPNRGFIEQPHEPGEGNTAWMRRAHQAMFAAGSMAREPLDDWTCIALLGGSNTESFRLRVAQAQLRRDLLPSLWSDVILVTNHDGSFADALATHVPLAQHRDTKFPPRENGVVTRPLADFDDTTAFPNVALIAMPVKAKDIDDRLRAFRRSRSTLDALEHVLRWLAFVWGVARTGNPLHENYGIPSACMLETVFSAAGFDLTPGLESRASCPEAIWSGARYWHDYFLEAIGKRPVGRFDKPHEYEITGTERRGAAPPEPESGPAAPVTTPRKRARKRGS